MRWKFAKIFYSWETLMSSENKTFRFEDHFSSPSKQYAPHRPRYPEAIHAYLASIAPGHSLAWDCGTGKGQAAIGLAKYFDQVHATDAIAAQISRRMYMIKCNILWNLLNTSR
jgi:hypothetical protein